MNVSWLHGREAPVPARTEPDAAPRRAPIVGMPFLNQRAPRGDVFSRPPLSKPQDLINFILGHRARRAAPRPPRVAVTLVCMTPKGRPAVEISL